MKSFSQIETLWVSICCVCHCVRNSFVCSLHNTHYICTNLYAKQICLTFLVFLTFLTQNNFNKKVWRNDFFLNKWIFFVFFFWHNKNTNVWLEKLYKWMKWNAKFNFSSSAASSIDSGSTNNKQSHLNKSLFPGQLTRSFLPM